MRCAIGFDLVDIARFAPWYYYSDRALMRVFTREEILYCKSEPSLAAQRFAVRFAAREAIYKALMRWSLGGRMPPFLTLCRSIAIRVTQVGVTADIEWSLMASVVISPPLSIQLSLSHAQTSAGAVVLLCDAMR